MSGASGEYAKGWGTTSHFQREIAEWVRASVTAPVDAKLAARSAYLEIRKLGEMLHAGEVDQDALASVAASSVRMLFLVGAMLERDLGPLIRGSVARNKGKKFTVSPDGRWSEDVTG